MFTSPNLGLTVWDQPNDDFNHTQLVQNWLSVDNHDHSNGKGVRIGTAGISPQAITQALLANGSVGNAQLQAGAVQGSNIQAGSIGTAQIATGAITGPLIAAGAVGAAALDPNILPVGSVMLWWRPPGSGATPDGFWEAMDGRAWNSISNYWGLTTGNIPDTRGVFAKGADILGGHGTPIGASGGSSSASLAHSHNVLGHTHSIPAHTHGIWPDGGHTHTWMGGLNMWARTNSFPKGTTIIGIQGQSHFNGYFSTYIQGLSGAGSWVPEQDQPGYPGIQHPIQDGQVSMDSAGTHSHGLATGATGGTTGSGTATTDTQLGSTTIDPPWTGLLYIMRCR
jgi:hypothetical protein